MNKPKVRGTIADKRLLNIDEVCTYIGLGQVRAREYMNEIGAVKKFGRRVLFDKTIIDSAINSK